MLDDDVLSDSVGGFFDDVISATTQMVTPIVQQTIQTAEQLGTAAIQEAGAQLAAEIGVPITGEPIVAAPVQIPIPIEPEPLPMAPPAPMLGVEVPITQKITDFAKENKTYLAIGGGVLLLLIIVLATRKKGKKKGR